MSLIYNQWLGGYGIAIRKGSESILWMLRGLISKGLFLIFRNVQRLINALEPVLDDGAKLQMLHYLSELLPEAEQQAFDRAAARMISRKMDSM